MHQLVTKLDIDPLDQFAVDPCDVQTGRAVVVHLGRAHFHQTLVILLLRLNLREHQVRHLDDGVGVLPLGQDGVAAGAHLLQLVRVLDLAVDDVRVDGVVRDAGIVVFRFGRVGRRVEWIVAVFGSESFLTILFSRSVRLGALVLDLSRAEFIFGCAIP